MVRFDVPSGWRIASGLDDTADPTVFTAPDYATLVDQPTLMGHRYMHLSPAALDAAIRLLETGSDTSRAAVEK